MLKVGEKVVKDGRNEFQPQGRNKVKEPEGLTHRIIRDKVELPKPYFKEERVRDSDSKKIPHDA